MTHTSTEHPASKNDLPTISTVYNQQPDGTWVTSIFVSGLRDEAMAVRVQEHIINSFCGGEIEEGAIQ